MYQHQINMDLEKTHSTQSATTGVPQGSTLGPLLFLTFNNDLPGILLYSDCILFADDTVLYLGGREVLYFLSCNWILILLSDWCNNNQKTLNQA